MQNCKLLLIFRIVDFDELPALLLFHWFYGYGGPRGGVGLTAEFAEFQHLPNLPNVEFAKLPNLPNNIICIIFEYALFSELCASVCMGGVEAHPLTSCSLS